MTYVQHNNNNEKYNDNDDDDIKGKETEKKSHSTNMASDLPKSLSE